MKKLIILFIVFSLSGCVLPETQMEIIKSKYPDSEIRYIGDSNFITQLENGEIRHLKVDNFTGKIFRDDVLISNDSKK